MLPLGFFSGVLALQFFRALPPFNISLTVFFIALGGGFLFSQRLRKFFLLFSAILLGFNWALFTAYRVLSWELPKNLEGKNLIITGQVVTLPEQHPGFLKFVFATKTIAAQKVNTRILLNWSVGGTRERPSNWKPHLGDELQLPVRLKRPHGMLNPGGFDFEQYLFERQIRATGYVAANSNNMRLNLRSHYDSMSTLREHLRTNIYHSLFHHPFTGIIAALVVGDQSGITASQWQVLRDTGTSYLVAIAGLHIGLVAAVAFFIVNFLWRRSARLVLLMPAVYIATIFGLIAAIIYSAVAGWSVPTQRALIMFGVFSLALLLQRSLQPWRALLLALLIVLIINPLAVLAAGFWLSFAAVAFIAYAVQGRAAKKGWFKRYAYLQFVVCLGLMPFTLLFFQQVSLAAFFANILALPGVCLVVVPLSLVGSFLTCFMPYFGGWLLWIAAELMRFIWWYIQLFNWSFFNWQQPIFNWWILVVTLGGIFLLLAPRRWWIKCLGVLCLLPVVFYSPSFPKYGEVWFSLLDVGQGLSAIIQTKNHVLVYDTGPRFATTDAGEAVIIPALRSFGRRKIDMLVISHGDEDHIGGAASLLHTFPTSVYTSVPERFTDAKHCYANQEWQWDGVKFKFLYPEEPTRFSGNNASCVLKISVGEHNILLTGDIEKPAEEIILAHAYDVKADILVAPHHGSKTSSSAEFIAATNPQYVLFPVGYHNRFRFPHRLIVERYLDNGAHLFEVDLTGMITFKFNAMRLFTPVLYRNVAYRYWND